MSERTELPVREERCETCRWWDKSDYTRQSKSGDCHRNPPKQVEMRGLVIALAQLLDKEDSSAHELFGFNSGWACTESDEWCGEWKAKDGAKRITAAYTSEDRKADAERLKTANDTDALAILRRMQQRTSPPDAPTPS